MYFSEIMFKTYYLVGENSKIFLVLCTYIYVSSSGELDVCRYGRCECMLDTEGKCFVPARVFCNEYNPTRCTTAIGGSDCVKMEDGSSQCVCWYHSKNYFGVCLPYIESKYMYIYLP